MRIRPSGSESKASAARHRPLAPHRRAKSVIWFSCVRVGRVSASLAGFLPLSKLSWIRKLRPETTARGLCHLTAARHARCVSASPFNPPYPYRPAALSPALAFHHSDKLRREIFIDRGLSFRSILFPVALRRLSFSAVIVSQHRARRPPACARRTAYQPTSVKLTALLPSTVLQKVSFG